MDTYVVCFLLLVVGMPVVYYINQCRKYRLKQKDNTEEDKNEIEQIESVNESINESVENNESSDSDQPLDDTPLTESDTQTTASISVQYRGRIDVKKMLESIVTENKFKETSVDLDKILTEILNQQKKN